MATTRRHDRGAAVEDLEEAIRGAVIQPGDSAYEEARTVYNAMIDKRPAIVVRCADVADVIAAVEFAREHEYETAVRSGGHNGPGLALVDDGLVVDLSRMNGVRVDPDAKTARVEPGCTWGDVDHATHAFGLATVSGVISTTGVGGLTLGGGHGYLTRQYGLTVDNLLGADVVLADGRLVHASEDENADLFWGLRGGGGNFGVVTSFEFELHPVETVTGGPMFWPIDALEPTMRWYREWLPRLPREVSVTYVVHEVSGDPFPPEIHGEKVCGLMWFSTGSQADLDPLLQEAREVADPLFEHVGPMPYPAVQSLFDGIYPPGDQWYWKGDFFAELTDEAIAVHDRYGAFSTSKSLVHLYPVDGAAGDVGPEETPWNHRDAVWSMVIAGVDPDPANVGAITDWAREYWEALHPHSAGAAYVNFMMEEGAERIRATYGDDYDRLREVKAAYDPDNVFHVNQNVEPED